MRIRIAHETRYRYDWPARSVLQVLRLSPRDHDGQHVVSWRIEPSVEGKLKPFEDGYGNACHTFEADESVEEITLSVSGDVEVQDTAGIVSGTPERLPDVFYLRETDLTAPDDAIKAFATETAGDVAADPLGALHRLLARIHSEVAFETGRTDSGTTAAQSFMMKRGVCQDLTHIFSAGARQLGIPARYVSGYFRRNDGVVDQDAGHAWAEAKVPGIGWIGFDPANGISTTDAHVRLAIGLDYLAAAPIRGSRRGGGAETLDVKLRVDTARRQAQD